jgi:hypothetical protein
MAKLLNLARMTTATTGTGTITLGSAVSGFLSFGEAGIVDQDEITYAIQDGTNSEIGRGVYTAAGTTLTRTVLKSTNSDSAISLSGAAQVFITPAAEDFMVPPSASVDGEIALFDGTGGRTLKRASTTGLLKASSGVLAQAVAGTDYVDPDGRRVAGDIFLSFDADPPDGCVELDGATITDGESTYPIVAARYAWMVSSGDLKLPDTRGRFPRGWANGSSNDPDRASRTARAGDGQTGDYPGTYQADELKSHFHSVAWKTGSAGSAAIGLSAGTDGSSNTGTTGGNETRAKNFAAMFCMVMG